MAVLPLATVRRPHTHTCLVPSAVGAQVTGLTAADFDLPTLGPLLRDVGREVHTGRGFALLRRLPVERWSREEVLVAYWGMALHW